MGCSGCGHIKLSHRLRANGDIHFIKKGPEPPPEIKGYRRDSGDDWLFHPIAITFFPCDSAIAFQTKDANGQQVMGRLCTHKEVKDTAVSPNDCKNCALRRNVKTSK